MMVGVMEAGSAEMTGEKLDHSTVELKVGLSARSTVDSKVAMMDALMVRRTVRSMVETLVDKMEETKVMKMVRSMADKMAD